MGNSFEFITLEMADGVGRLTLNRPPLNILHIPMLRELETALEEAAGPDDVRVLVLRAEGKLFSAGVDVADHTAEKVGEMIPLVSRVCKALDAFPAPTLAVVQGHALGGGLELVLCCDMAVTAEGAKLGQPEIKLATFPPIAALRLPALVGRPLAAEMVFTGRTLTGVEAEDYGLVNRSAPLRDLGAVAEEVVEELHALSAPALRLCKRALRLGQGGWDNLDSIEDLYLKDLMATADVHEGLEAYSEKRPPLWQHK